MPLYIALPGFFVCTCLGYGLACFLSMLGDASRQEERLLEEARELEAEVKESGERTKEWIKNNHIKTKLKV